MAAFSYWLILVLDEFFLYVINICFMCHIRDKNKQINVDEVLLSKGHAALFSHLLCMYEAMSPHVVRTSRETLMCSDQR